MHSPGNPWIGVDVGGPRKGFHAAALGDHAGWSVEFADLADVAAAVAWVQQRTPELVAIDSPRSWAGDDDGSTGSRRCEREFAAAGICGIRYTPSRDIGVGHPTGYYGWIVNGLELWRALEDRGVPVVECFPTASWTRWYGPRNTRSRARWTGAALQQLRSEGLRGAEQARNQDRRDALAAALTARQATIGSLERFGPIVVPAPGTTPGGPHPHSGRARPASRR